MRRIAMFNCLKSNRVCSGASCLKAYHERTRAFARYAGEQTELIAFARCNGCEISPQSDDGLHEKIDRLVQEGVETVHLGACTARGGRECPTMTYVAEQLARRGVEIVRGTHR